MKIIFNQPAVIYAVATLACICIMIIVDFMMGPEAEHLNAWVIVNRLVGNDIGIADSLAIQKLGLPGATLLMLFVNSIFGIVLISLIRLVIHFFHS